MHHASSGNLDRRGFGDVDTLTVHHLSSRIPYYRLPCVLREHPELRAINRLSLLESFRCVRLVLWDESRRCLVPFRDRPSSQ